MRYGYDTWFYSCTQDQLQCNGQDVKVAEDLDDLSVCNVTHRACPHLQDSYASCQRYDILCDGDRVDNCTFQHLPVHCTSNTTQSQCTPSLFNCNGNLVRWIDMASKNLSECTIVQMNCSGVSTSISDTCHLSTVTCGNTTSTIQPFIRNSTLFRSDCYVHRLFCSQADTCQISLPVCETNQNCFLDDYMVPCRSSDTCQKNVNTSRCICPMDRFNQDCSGNRKLECRIFREIPEECNVSPPQEAPQKYLDSDWPCFVFHDSENASMSFKLKCQFDTAPNITQEMIDANFTYSVEGPDWALTNGKPENWTLSFRYQNFFKSKLSDQTGTTFLKLSARQIGGWEASWWNVSKFSSIPDRFWAGNRLWMEVRLENLDGSILKKQESTHLYIDVPGRPISNSNVPSVERMSSQKIFLIVAAGLVSIGILFWIFRKIFLFFRGKKRRLRPTEY
eukprot:TRINITY_DN6415_c0_g1_i3.p1 TRINITY_DN6415_c0_g1~~TRINITY_DN6415_c0_g1_i3.p1  ORF type:complete len:449 (-),score=86.67 TRINITY_DN6415_c0_g1_i3:14-1360(-)